MSHLQLTFTPHDGRTQLHRGTQQPPWRVIRAFHLPDGTALTHLNNVSGGVLAGDDLTLDVTLAPGARAQLTTTGATRLYRHRPGAPDSRQTTRLHLAENTILDYLPDPLIPFAGSRHHQRVEVELAPGAALFWQETLAPGRQAMGETFAFDSLTLEADVRTTDHHPLHLEFARLEPALRDLRATARFGPFTHMATLYVFAPGHPPSDWTDLERITSGICSQRSTPGCTIWGSSALATSGLVVRGLGVSGRFLPATLAELWKISRRFLTNEEVELPRKVY